MVNGDAQKGHVLGGGKRSDRARKQNECRLCGEVIECGQLYVTALLLMRTHANGQRVAWGPYTAFVLLTQSACRDTHARGAACTAASHRTKPSHGNSIDRAMYVHPAVSTSDAALTLTQHCIAGGVDSRRQ